MEQAQDILLVEDDAGQARLAQRALRRAGYAASWVETAGACLERVEAAPPMLVLLDRGLPDGDGLDVLAALHQRWPELCVVMLTGADDVTVAVRAMQAGAWDYVLKRPDLSHLDDLPLVIKRNTERVMLRRERRLLDAAVRRSEERHRELFDNASDLIVVCDVGGAIQRTNKAFEELTGVESAAAEGRALGDFFAECSPLHAEALRARTLAADGQPVAAEVHLVGRNGEPVPVELRARPIFEGGEVQGFQGIGRDVREKRQMEQMRADFLAMITHDMKNPVSVIVGYTEILLNDACPTSECREMLVGIDASSRGLLHLIMNFLDLSRIEAGALRLNRKATGVNEVLQGVVEYETPLARAKRIEIREELQEVPEVLGDWAQLDRVFTNLVGNAIKYTPPGGHVAIRSRAENGSVLVQVSDTGPGIPPDQIPILFRRYQRLSQTAQIEGTGLGLFIVKSIVDGHDGTISVESEPGAGATFTVSLPANS